MSDPSTPDEADAQAHQHALQALQKILARPAEAATREALLDWAAAAPIETLRDAAVQREAADLMRGWPLPLRKAPDALLRTVCDARGDASLNDQVRAFHTIALLPCTGPLDVAAMDAYESPNGELDLYASILSPRADAAQLDAILARLGHLRHACVRHIDCYETYHGKAEALTPLISRAVDPAQLESLHLSGPYQAVTLDAWSRLASLRPRHLTLHAPDRQGILDPHGISRGLALLEDDCRLASLAIFASIIDEDDVRALALERAARLPHLRSLHLNAPERAADLPALLGGSAMSGLRALSLGLRWAPRQGPHDRSPEAPDLPPGATTPADEAARALAQTPLAADLRHLALSADTLTQPAMEALITSPHLANLRTLLLLGDHADRAHLTDLASAHLPHLDTLTINRPIRPTTLLQPAWGFLPGWMPAPTSLDDLNLCWWWLD